jgi:hypothetical protein
MKSITLVASLVAASVVAAATPPYRIGNSRVSHSCDLELNVVDPDPLGPNVRSGPSVRTGKVIARFAPQGEWTYVHVVGQAGAWFLIDRATVVDDAAPDGERVVFRGGGWMHSSTLGFSELMTGEGTLLREAPSADAKVVRTVSMRDDQSEGRIRVLGCRGKFIKVNLGDIAPWTDTWCNNERTTCS